MPRSYWRYVLATIGLLALLGVGHTAYQLYNAAEQQHSDYRYQPAREAGGAVLVPPNAEPKGYQPNCQNPQGNANADLCAQWAAVDQVTEANRLNALNVRMALFIALLTLTGTSLLVWTFIETRDTVRRELRAYVCIDSIGIVPGTAKGTPAIFKGIVACEVTAKNSGQTPAYDLRHWAQIMLLPISDSDNLEVPKLTRTFMSTVPPGGSTSSVRRLEAKITQTEAAALKAGELALFVWGRLEYADAFGREHFTNYRMIGTGRWPLPATGHPQFCERGNESS